MAITNTGGCHGMGTLGNLPLASAYGRYIAAALSCIQWKVHHKFHVPHVIIEYSQLQFQFTIYNYSLIGTEEDILLIY